MQGSMTFRYFFRHVNNIIPHPIINRIDTVKKTPKIRESISTVINILNNSYTNYIIFQFKIKKY